MFDHLHGIAGAVLIASLAPGAVAAQEWESISLSRAFNGERALSVEVEYGAGTLSVQPGTAASLYHAVMRFDADSFEPVTSYEDGRLRIGMDGENGHGHNVEEGGELTLRLSPRTRLDIDLAFGAAKANLELGGLQIETLEISTGASVTSLAFSQPNPIVAESMTFEVGAARFEATGLGNTRARHLSVEAGVGEIVLDFSGAWEDDMDASVEMGLGKLTLRLPRGLGVHIEKDGLLASLDADGLIRNGNRYYTEGFEDADRKLTIEVDAAFNAIEVVWVGSLQANAN